MTNFSNETIKAVIIDTLENGFDGYVSDLHNEAFNTDYYIIGTSKAKQALTDYDVFEAVEKIKQYEKNNFGEVYTDFLDPEKVANTLAYILGEEILNDCEAYTNNLDETMTSEIAKDIINNL